MNKKMYLRGIAGQIFYNSTELLAMALTYRPIPKEIEHKKKIHYGKDKKNYIITFCRKDMKEQKKPLFLYIHGGGWISGIVEMRNPYIVNWAKLGFFTTSVNYTNAPQKVFPAQIKELFAAIDYIVDRADEYNFDPENIVIAGESAGGYFISYIASCLNDPTILGKLGIEFRSLDKIKIKALVSHSGAFSFENLLDPEKKQSKFPDIKMMLRTFTGMNFKELGKYIKTEEGKLLSPQITEKFPPSYLTWCTRDFLRYETFDLMEKLEKFGVPHREFKGEKEIGNHAWTIVTMFSKAKACLRDTVDFVLPYLPEYFEKEDEKWTLKK